MPISDVAQKDSGKQAVSRPIPVRAGEVSGVQSIKRAMMVLQYIASLPDGVRLRDAAHACGLNKTTCHRILTALVEEGFLQTNDNEAVYRLGQEALAVGWSARARQDIPALAKPGMMRLSEKTGDTVFLSIRSGFEALCIAREVGSFPIKTLTLDVGSRRPLGVGAGSLALLAFASPHEWTENVHAIELQLASYPAFSRSALKDLAETTKRIGHAFNDQGVIEGMSAVGVPVLGEDNKPLAALSIAAISSRMQESRRKEIVDLLSGEAQHLSSIMTGRLDPATQYPSSNNDRKNGRRGGKR